MTSIHETLKTYWGYDQFRPLQEDIIQSVMLGKDTLALMPTGGGKSICFQVPALAQEGICIVISPLIALMKDQVMNLKNRDIKAEALFSGMNKREIDRILDNCIYGNIKLLYVSPERLHTEIFQERLKKMKVNLIAIDEAHCISQWGYDFRPSYLQIAQIRQWINEDIPFLALTASATIRVREDIIEKLELKAANVFKKSFARANLSYSVFKEENKVQRLVNILQKVPGTGIVYVRSRKQTKDIANLLRRHRIRADYYHAGLTGKTRSIKQEQWMHNKTRVMVCTNAFGMGIDKPDVRVVVHIGLPESLEAYYQEAGRGGRDLKKSYAVLLYHEGDISQLQRMHEISFPPMDEVKKSYQAIANHYQLANGAGMGMSYPFDLGGICKTFNIHPTTFYHSLKMLEEAGYVSTNDAVFQLSKLRFIVNKEELYKFEVANKKLDPYIKAILRTYGGAAFDDYIEIRESKLAANYRVHVSHFVKVLHYLHQQNIIDYIPQSDVPKINFTRERVSIDSLVLDQEMIAFRKQVKKNNIDSVIAYAQNQIHCRSLQLIRYYGETDGKACEVCDLCLQRRKLGLEEKRFETIAQFIVDTLSETAENVLPLTDLITKESFPQKEVMEMIRWMSDQKMIEVDEERNIHKLI